MHLNLSCPAVSHLQVSSQIIPRIMYNHACKYLWTHLVDFITFASGKARRGCRISPPRSPRRWWLCNCCRRACGRSCAKRRSYVLLLLGRKSQIGLHKEWSIFQNCTKRRDYGGRLASSLPVHQRCLADGDVADNDHLGDSESQALALAGPSDQAAKIALIIRCDFGRERWRPVGYLSFKFREKEREYTFVRTSKLIQIWFPYLPLTVGLFFHHFVNCGARFQHLFLNPSAWRDKNALLEWFFYTLLFDTVYERLAYTSRGTRMIRMSKRKHWLLRQVFDCDT